MKRFNFYRIFGWGLVVLLLLSPWLAMQFNPVTDPETQDGVNWTLGDFIVAGLLLGGTGLLIELAVKFSENITYRLGIVLTIITSLLLIWINLAVGIIGSEDNPANGMYLIVLAITPIGGLFVRWRAGEMRNLLVAVALAQLTVGAISMLFGFTHHFPSALFLNSGFAILWLMAAGLFHNATEAHNNSIVTSNDR